MNKNPDVIIDTDPETDDALALGVAAFCGNIKLPLGMNKEK